MKHLSQILGSALLLSAMVAAPAVAANFAAPVEAPARALPVAANCNAVAQQVGAEYGGRAKGTAESRNGEEVCVVVVVVEGKEGERAKRIEVVVPAK
jgi:hypothetical protein